jgi:hypothetical protein
VRACVCVCACVRVCLPVYLSVYVHLRFYVCACLCVRTDGNACTGISTYVLDSFRIYAYTNALLKYACLRSRYSESTIWSEFKYRQGQEFSLLHFVQTGSGSSQPPI